EAYELEVGRARLHRLQPREQVAWRSAPGAEIDAAARPDRRQCLLQAHELRVVVNGFRFHDVVLHGEDALNDRHLETPEIGVDIPSIDGMRVTMGRSGASDNRGTADPGRPVKSFEMLMSYTGLEIAWYAWKILEKFGPVGIPWHTPRDSRGCRDSGQP